MYKLIFIQIILTFTAYVYFRRVRGANQNILKPDRSIHSYLIPISAIIYLAQMFAIPYFYVRSQISTYTLVEGSRSPSETKLTEMYPVFMEFPLDQHSNFDLFFLLLLPYSILVIPYALRIALKFVVNLDKLFQIIVFQLLMILMILVQLVFVVNLLNQQVVVDYWVGNNHYGGFIDFEITDGYNVTLFLLIALIGYLGWTLRAYSRFRKTTTTK